MTPRGQWRRVAKGNSEIRPSWACDEWGKDEEFKHRKKVKKYNVDKGIQTKPVNVLAETWHHPRRAVPRSIRRSAQRPDPSPRDYLEDGRIITHFAVPNTTTQQMTVAECLSRPRW
nr:hypothetical protein L204_02831 [Cryptococcus depauperatus CBS 7855]